jgi:hypothetical protein
VKRLALLLLLFSCRPDELGTMPTLELPAWQDGEASVYEVRRDDSVVYRCRITLELSEEAGLAAGNAGQSVPTVVVTSALQPVLASEFFSDSVRVVLRREDLKPVRSFRSLETEVSEAELVTMFESGQAQVTRSTVDGVDEELLSLPDRSYAHDALQTLLRAVPPVPGSSFGMHLVVPVDFRVVRVKVQVLGTKMVSTPLGDILCREVSVSSPGRETRFLYELAEPRRFVGLRDVVTDARMLLVSYTPAHPDTLPVDR